MRAPSLAEHKEPLAQGESSVIKIFTRVRWYARGRNCYVSIVRNMEKLEWNWVAIAKLDWCNKLGDSKPWPMGEILPTACFINKLWLEYSHTCHLHIIYSCFCTTKASWIVVRETLWSQSLKCLLYSSIKKKFADPCKRKKKEKELEWLTSNCKTKCQTQKTFLTNDKDALVPCSGKAEKLWS